MGRNCKYNGGNNYNAKVAEYVKDMYVIEICPESEGGLKCPREPAEIRNGRAYPRDGKDVDIYFRTGAEKAAERIRESGAELAILQPRSPSCGIGLIYDGTFSGKLIPGNGMLAQALIDMGIKVITPDEIPQKKTDMYIPD
jgi:uncharacterized protein YbbK (DUF523 family)